MNPNPTITLALSLDRINMLLQALHGQTQAVSDDITAQCNAWLQANKVPGPETVAAPVDAQLAQEAAA